MKKINIPFLLLFNYYIFTFTIERINIFNHLIVYFVAIICIVLNYNILINAIKKVKPRILLLLISMFGSILTWSIIYPILRGTNDFSYFLFLLSIIRTSIKTLFLYVVFVKIYKEDANVDLFMKYFILSSVIYVLGTMLFFLFPEFKLFWQSVIFDTPRNKKLLLQSTYVMRFGTVGFSGFQQTFIMSIAGTFNAYLIMKSAEKGKISSSLLTSQILLFVGNTFYGRIGLISSTIILVIISIYLSMIDKRYIFRILLIVAISFVVLVVLYYTVKSLQIWFIWGFALFFNLIRYGSIGTGSSSHMFETMFVDISPKTFIFGDALYTNPPGSQSAYYMATDIGVIRPILFYGIIFTVIAYLLTLLIVFYSCKNMKNDPSNISKIFFVMVIITLIIFEFKGEIFYRLIGYFIPILLLSAVSTEKEEGSDVSISYNECI